MEMKELVEKAKEELLEELSSLIYKSAIEPVPFVRFYRPTSGNAIADEKGVGKLNTLINGAGGPSIYGWEGPHKTYMLGLSVVDEEGWLRQWINNLGTESIRDLPFMNVEIIIQHDYHGYVASADRFRVVTIALDTFKRNINPPGTKHYQRPTTNIEFGIEWTGAIDDEDRLKAHVDKNPTIADQANWLHCNNEMVREFVKLSTGVDGFPIKHRFQILHALNRRQDVTKMIEKIVADHRG